LETQTSKFESHLNLAHLTNSFIYYFEELHNTRYIHWFENGSKMYWRG